MAAITDGRALTVEPGFLSLPGKAQQWLGVSSPTRWLDVVDSTTPRALEMASPFMPLTAPRESAEDSEGAVGVDAEALQAAQGFEKIFVQYLMKSMRSSVPEGGLLGKSFASGVYQGMFDEYLSEQASTGGGLGLADMLYNEIVRERQGRIAYQSIASGSTESLASDLAPAATFGEPD